MTNGVGRTKRAMSDAAPAQRMTASWRGDRGPNRPANTPSRLAMNGAAASAARPSGSRPPRRATVGQERRDQGHAHPDADGSHQVEREIAPERAPIRRCER